VLKLKRFIKDNMSIKTAIILAAGKGTRLDSVTGGEFPKPLTPIAGIPILEYSIQALISCGVNRILLGCGYMIESFAYLVEKYEGIEIIENPKFDRLGSLSTLMIFESLVSESFYLLEADIIYDPVVLKSLSNEDLTKNYISISKAAELDDNIFVCSMDETLINVKRQVDRNAERSEVMTGIWAFSNGFMDRFVKFCSEENQDLTSDYEIALANYSAKKEAIKTSYLDTFKWCEIDNEEHYQYAIKKIWPDIKDSY